VNVDTVEAVVSRTKKQNSTTKWRNGTVIGGCWPVPRPSVTLMDLSMDSSYLALSPNTFARIALAELSNIDSTRSVGGHIRDRSLPRGIIGNSHAWKQLRIDSH